MQEWIVKREARLRMRAQGGTRRSPNDMVYAVDESRSPAQAPSAPESDPWQASAADPWAGRSAPQPQPQPQPPPQQAQAQAQWPGWSNAPAYTSSPHDPWAAGGAPDSWAGDLGAFNKGKGKGGPKGPLTCYKCDGKGHPERLCASAPGAKGAGGPRCEICQGLGHAKAACASKGRKAQ